MRMALMSKVYKSLLWVNCKMWLHNHIKKKNCFPISSVNIFSSSRPRDSIFELTREIEKKYLFFCSKRTTKTSWEHATWAWLVAFPPSPHPPDAIFTILDGFINFSLCDVAVVLIFPAITDLSHKILMNLGMMMFDELSQVSHTIV